MRIELPAYYSKCSPKERKEIREEYIRQQKGLCCYCNEPLDGPPRKDILKKYILKSLFPKGFFNSPIHLQHDHKSDLTEGAVHAYCNAVLWQYEGR